MNPNFIAPHQSHVSMNGLSGASEAHSCAHGQGLVLIFMPVLALFIALVKILTPPAHQWLLWSSGESLVWHQLWRFWQVYMDCWQARCLVTEVSCVHGWTLTTSNVAFVWCKHALQKDHNHKHNLKMFYGNKHWIVLGTILKIMQKASKTMTNNVHTL